MNGIRPHTPRFPLVPHPRTWGGHLRDIDGPATNLRGGQRRFVTALLRYFAPVHLLAVLLSAVNYVSSALLPWALGRIINQLAAGFSSDLARDLAVLVLLIAVAAMSQGIWDLTEVIVWVRLALEPIMSIGAALTRRPRRIRTAHPSGDVLTGMGEDPNALGSFSAWGAEFVAGVFSILLVAVLMLRVSPTLGALVLVGVPVVIAASVLTAKPLEARQAELRDAKARLATIATDSVAGLRVLRGIGGEQVYRSAYATQSDAVRDAGIRLAPIVALFSSVGSVGPLFLSALVVVQGAFLVARGQIMVGDLVAFYGYMTFLNNPMRMITRTIEEGIRARVAVRKMSAIIETGGGDGCGDRPRDEGVAARPSIDWTRATLEDPTSGVQIRPGEITALVGPTAELGAAIAQRLALLDEGETLVDGVDMRSLPLEEVRRSVLFAGANAHIFEGSLRESLLGAAAPGARDRSMLELLEEYEAEAFESDDTAAPALVDATRGGQRDLALVDALKAADAGDVLDSLPGGLDGRVHEKGRNLSGGQRQRVALARALAAEAPILVLVEPTSALDSHTEVRVARNLAQVRRGRTTLIVTTSALVVEHCDAVIALGGDGRAVARMPERSIEQPSGARDGARS